MRVARSAYMWYWWGGWELFILHCHVHYSRVVRTCLSATACVSALGRYLALLHRVPPCYTLRAQYPGASGRFLFGTAALGATLVAASAAATATIAVDWSDARSVCLDTGAHLGVEERST